MREIKFRAWDRTLKEMTYGRPQLVLRFSGKVTEGSIVPDITLMQHTGLKDKNGKEIYEGDIVRGPSDSAVILQTLAKRNRRDQAIFTVEWLHPMADWPGFALVSKSEMERTYPRLNECEIIGNVWENPELLRESDESR